MPFQLKPVCTSFYEEIVRGDYYFLKAWMAFVFIYAVSFFFRYAYKLKKRNGQLLFDISTLVNFQKLAVLLMIQAPIMVLPMAFDSERMASIVAQNNNKLHIAILHSAVSMLLLALLLYFTIHRGSQHLKKIRKKLLEADVINPKETIEGLKNQ
ncbi:hypothetical protein TL16_g02220 [Triparma laevis f. inornata]|uniref:Uncharacterized protein n=1 Tax=Triparma laevis f. inornata TaxID=1714386 RepID=A0A9W6ZSZ1_9STRA|nr:hypothetical protein TL16_g02220 [Triparma laevis f. inornata]